MNLTRVTDRVYYLPGDPETDAPFLYYIRGDNCSAAVDAGQSRAHVQAFYNAIREAGFPLPRYTLITHWHWDHTFGLPYVQGETFASVLTQQKLRAVAGWLWTPEAMAAREQSGEDIPFCTEHIRKAYPDLREIWVQPAETAISGTRVFDLGGVRVQAYARDSIHSRDALMLYVPEESALFAGDADCEDFYRGGEIDPARVEDYTYFVRRLPFRRYFLGHALPVGRPFVMGYLAGMRLRAAKPQLPML